MVDLVEQNKSNENMNTLGDFPVVFEESLYADEVLVSSPSGRCGICGRKAILIVASTAPSLTIAYCDVHKFKVLVDGQEL